MKHLTRAVFSNVLLEQPLDPLGNKLVVRRRGRRHEEVSINDLVAAVFWEEEVILVRELK